MQSLVVVLDAEAKGTTGYAAVRPKHLLKAVIPLPPLDEQRRIVARIEELAAKIEEARVLRQQTIDETLSFDRSYLTRIYVNLAKRFPTQSLSEVCQSITDGDHNTPPFTEEGVRFIFVGNVSSGHLHFRNCKWVDPKYFKTISPQRVPKRGDILYSAVGATLGIPVVVTTDEHFCFQRHIAIIKPDRNCLDSDFAWHMLRSEVLYQKAWASTTGSAQPTVPLKSIRRLPIPLPPISEQRRIVAYLDNMKAKIDALKLLQAETATELDALLPAVLDRAFKGEL
ncbi:MAG: restriction endonuclease subunit S [Chloroflexi bacterium]|nr:restriction endonuclease subunit S [Chloroflexota bacterium]